MPGDRPIIFFGSSLNPPTKAHKALVAYMLEVTKNQKPRPLIVIAPVYKHIFSKLDLADFEPRQKLTEAQFQKEIEEGNLIVSEIEKRVYQHHNPNPDPNNPGAAYSCGSVDVLRYIKQHPELFPEADVNHISFMLGADTYKDFVGGLWKEAENIIGLCDEFHVFGRDGAEPIAAQELCEQAKRSVTQTMTQEKAQIRLAKLEKISDQLQNDVNKFKFHTDVIADPMIQKISSTKIRADFKQFGGLEKIVLDQMMAFYPDLYPSTRALKEEQAEKKKSNKNR